VFHHTCEIRKHWCAIYAIRAAYEKHPWEF
jgi:hypothetical protein